MADQYRPAHHLAQIMSVMNLLHRLAMTTPPETFAPGMTMPQLATVATLTFLEGQDVYQRDLETIFKLRRSTVSSVTSTLERKGYLTRVPVPEDARLKKLVLTDAGQAVGAHVYEIFSHLNDLMIAGLTQEELRSFGSILDKIAGNLAHAEDAPRCPATGTQSTTSTCKEAPAT